MALLATFPHFRQFARDSSSAKLELCASVELLRVQGKTTSCVCLSAQDKEASGAFKRERGWAVKDLVTPRQARNNSFIVYILQPHDRAWLIASELRDSGERSSAERSAKKTLSLAFLRQNSKLPYNRSSCRHHTHQAKVKSTETPRIDILKNTRSCVIQRERMHPPYRLLTAAFVDRW